MEFPTLESQRKFFTSICELANVNITWSPTATQPCAGYQNGQATIHLSAPDVVDWDKWLWAAYHEVGHVMPELLYQYEALGLVKNQEEKNVLNILMDGVNEKNRHGHWPGRDRALYNGVFKFAQEHAHEWLLKKPDVFQAVSAWDDLQRQEWQGVFKLSTISSSAEKILERIKGMSLETRIEENLKSKDPKELYQIVLDIIEAAQEVQNGSGETGETDDSQEADGQGQESEGSEQGATDSSGSSESRESTAPTSGTNESQNSGSKGVGASENDLAGGRYKDAGRKPLPPKQSGEFYTPFPKIKVSTMPDTPNNETLQQISRLTQGSTVSHQIQTYLKIMSKDSYERGLTEGRLNTRAIHRLYNTPAGQAPKIFKKKNQHRLKVDTAVSLLLDRSGSMKGDEYHTGAACVYCIAETLRELRIPFEAACFRSPGSSNVHEFYKQFGENVSRDTLLNRLAHPSEKRPWGSNADGENIMYSAERLMAQGQRGKLLIVLSDGRPTSGAEGNDEWYLKRVTRLIEEESPIDLIGIGIQTSVVEQFYRNHAVVNKIQDLDAVLFETLKRNLV